MVTENPLVRLFSSQAGWSWSELTKEPRVYQIEEEEERFVAKLVPLLQGEQSISCFWCMHPFTFLLNI